MSTTNRRMLFAAALAVVAAIAIAASLFSARGEQPAPVASAPSDLRRLDLNSLGRLGAPGRLRTVGMPHPSRLATLPGELMVYEVVPVNVTPAFVEKEAKRFGVQGTARKHGDMTMIKGSSGDVLVDNETGSVNWITPSYEEASMPMKHRLTDEKYIALAEQFLQERGLWKNDYAFSGISEYTTEGDPMMVEVNFGRDLNGLKWQGVGPKKTVAFGDNGKIVGYFSVWREVRAMAKYPLVKPSAAIRQIEAGNALVGSAESNVDATAEEVELVYINDGAGIKQRFVAPYYKVSGKTASGKPFTAVTRAIPLQLVNEQPDEFTADEVTPEPSGRTE